MSRNDWRVAILDGWIGGIMEIIIEAPKKKKQYITRDKKHGNGGVIRVDEETCDVLERIIKKLECQIDVKTLASALIKAAADNAIIKVKEEE